MKLGSKRIINVDHETFTETGEEAGPSRNVDTELLGGVLEGEAGTLSFPLPQDHDGEEPENLYRIVLSKEKAVLQASPELLEHLGYPKVNKMMTPIRLLSWMTALDVKIFASRRQVLGAK